MSRRFRLHTTLLTASILVLGGVFPKAGAQVFGQDELVLTACGYSLIYFFVDNLKESTAKTCFDPQLDTKTLLQDAGVTFDPARYKTAISPYKLETSGRTVSLTAAGQTLYYQVMTPQEAKGRQLGPFIFPASLLNPTDRRDAVAVAWAKVCMQALIRVRAVEADDVPFARKTTCADKKLPLLLAGQPLLKGLSRPTLETKLVTYKNNTYSLAWIINVKLASGRWISASYYNTWTDAAALMVPRLALGRLPLP